jgi:hypothetical protein
MVRPSQFEPSFVVVTVIVCVRAPSVGSINMKLVFRCPHVHERRDVEVHVETPVLGRKSLATILLLPASFLVCLSDIAYL